MRIYANFDKSQSSLIINFDKIANPSSITSISLAQACPDYNDLATFLIIGFFHPIVIKAEYHFGVKCWWVFALVGIITAVLSLLVDHTVLSALLGVVAFSSFWSSLEVFGQRERVRKGWFPDNPKRKMFQGQK